MRFIGSVGLALIVAAIGGAADVPTASVLYVANEGFLVEAGGKKVLIDALFDDRTIGFAHIPNEETLARMKTSEAPFDDVDVMLFTHRHRDHFGLGSVYERMTNDPSIVMVGPTQVVDDLRVVAPALEGIDDRIHELDLGLFESTKLKVDGIRIRASRVRHSRYMETDPSTGAEVDRHRNVENLIYLVDLDGFSFLHVGDATLDQNADFFDDKGFQKEEIDVVFLEFFDWSDETKAMIEAKRAALKTSVRTVHSAVRLIPANSYPAWTTRPRLSK